MLRGYPLSMDYRRIIRTIVWLALVALVLSRSSIPLSDSMERVRAFTRNVEFNYATWTLQALITKLDTLALNSVNYLPATSKRETVLEYLAIVREIQNKEAQISAVYTNPEIDDPQSSSAQLRAELEQNIAKQRELAPLAEAVLQYQIAQVVAQMGLAYGGQPLPPILYHNTPVPKALIVSPRDTIRQDADISISPQMSLEQQITLEDQVDKALNVSSLVVGIGGIGIYPTMVMQTSDINWLTEVVAHEWIHNFLTLRPLGASYLSAPELRTMNETVASIAGKEISQMVLESYYPEFIPTPTNSEPPAPGSSEPPAFDFRAEMHQTRITVDRLLANGAIDKAESYMEQRRAFFWEHGYHLRKLNQAYFAFYGAYADQPGGAAGIDPVGAAVRSLRSRSPSLAAFIKHISWMWSFEQLQQDLEQAENSFSW